MLFDSDCLESMREREVQLAGVCLQHRHDVNPLPGSEAFYPLLASASQHTQDVDKRFLNLEENVSLHVKQYCYCVSNLRGTVHKRLQWHKIPFCWISVSENLF